MTNPTVATRYAPTDPHLLREDVVADAVHDLMALRHAALTPDQLNELVALCDALAALALNSGGVDERR